jgi:hypothetical protein
VISGIANRVGKSVLHQDNCRTVCPPGSLPGRVSGVPNIVVATCMRTGTHLLLDLIINNFSDYKRTPLYINLDMLFRQPDWFQRDCIEKIRSCGGFLIKTHYPQEPGPSDDIDMKLGSILDRSLVVTTERDFAAQAASLARFSPERRLPSRVSGITRFGDYWKSRGRPADLVVRFETLVSDPSGSVVQELATAVGLVPNQKLILPSDHGSRHRVYLDKIMTRTLGARSPRINTGIGFKL